MISLDVQVVSTALTTIRLHLGASIEELEWTVNAYILTFAVFLLTGAALGDRFGRRRMFIVGLGLFVAASAACALAPNIGALIAARTVQGCGAAIILPLTLTLLSAAFEPVQRGRALGIFGSVTGLALIAGPVVGGAIAGGLAWQGIFWLNVPLGLLVIVLVLRSVPESFGPRTALDIAGLLLVTGAALGLVWGLVRGNQAGWGSVEVVATLLAGTGLAVAFVSWELRVRMPMVPMRFFRSRTFSSGNAASFLLFASMNGAIFFMAQFLQTGQGYGPLAAGLRLLPLTATLFLVAPIAGTLVNRVGERVLIVVGLLAEAVGMTWIALIARADLPYAKLVAPLIKAFSLRPPSSSLPKNTYPLVGRSTPVNILNMVDLPLPEGPLMANRDRSGMLRGWRCLRPRSGCCSSGRTSFSCALTSKYAPDGVKRDRPVGGLPPVLRLDFWPGEETGGKKREVSADHL